MNLTITITAADGSVKAQSSGVDCINLVYPHPYEEGDSITLLSDTAGFITTQLEDSIQPIVGWISSEYCLKIPFGEKRISYSPKSFTGNMHLLWARKAQPYESAAYRNLALNPLDSHENTGLFPHASANVETRGESVFAARNAINGNTCGSGHGAWPYESWGINRQSDAEITIDFGRPVLIDRLIVTLRSDFPHDNWWKEATVQFSDGSKHVLSLEKTALPQDFPIEPREASWLKMNNLIKDETDPSPFPALIQVEAWGYSKKPS